ncbi:MAG: hypothetical protein ACE5IP_01080 [Terriglobia bacterium]
MKEKKRPCKGRSHGEGSAQTEECQEEKNLISVGDWSCVCTPFPKNDEENDSAEKKVEEVEDKPVLNRAREQFKLAKLRPKQSS